MRAGSGLRHKRCDALNRMLSIGIHGQRMREPEPLRFEQPVEYRGALTAVPVAYDDSQLRVRSRHLTQRRRSAIRASIDDHPYGRPLRSGLANRLNSLGARVVTRDKYQVCRRGRQSSLSTVRVDCLRIQMNAIPPDQ